VQKLGTGGVTLPGMFLWLGRHLPQFSEYLNEAKGFAQRNDFHCHIPVFYAESDSINNIITNSGEVH